MVELGAGKGYLGGTLAVCAGVRRLVATDIVAGLRLKVRCVCVRKRNAVCVCVCVCVSGVCLVCACGAMTLTTDEGQVR